MSHNGHNIKLKEVLKATGAKDFKEAVTRLGYGEMFGLDDNEGFDYIIRLTKPEEVTRILPLPWQYGNYEGEKLAEALAALMQAGRIMYVEFGRQRSPVVIVFMKNPEQDRAPLTDLLKMFAPDELDEYGPWAIRAWWD